MAKRSAPATQKGDELRALKPAHFPTLLHLLLLGARDRPIHITTAELAERIGRSQQAASKHILELEEEGFIRRVRAGSRSGIQLTPRAVETLTLIQALLKSRLESPPTQLELRGRVFTGLGEGAYYVSLKGYRRQFIKKLGFDPYPGTLNLRLSTPADIALRRELKHYDGIHIEGFEDGHRTYGWVKCLPATIGDEVRGAVISNVERGHYDETVLEVIAPIYLRKALNLKDGDEVEVRVLLDLAGLG